MSAFDPRRFAHLSETEVLCRIGALLAAAIARCGSQRSPLAVPATDNHGRNGDPLDLLKDPVEKKIVQYLRLTGPIRPTELVAALGLNGRTTARKLARLRAAGLCEAFGKTRAVSYRLRTDSCAS